MKKLIKISLSAFITFFAFGVLACSPDPDVVYPTLDAVLADKDLALAIVRPDAKSSETTGRVVIGNKNADLEVGLHQTNSSCSTRTDVFSPDEYILVVYKKDDKVIRHEDLDHQFSFPFKNKDEAVEKYSDFVKKWENRKLILDSLIQNGTLSSDSYIPAGFTLRPGLKNDDNVRALQKALVAKLGTTDFTIDGSYGPATQKLVKEFQEKMGLDADGLAGVKTQAKLVTLVETENTTKPTEEKKEEAKPVTDLPEKATEPVNKDLVNAELVKLIIQARDAIRSYKTTNSNYTDAHSLVVEYNNGLLKRYPQSDPLYKSLDGGSKFVYFAKNTDGQYICVDDSSDQLTTKTVSPLSGGTISC